MINVRDIIWAAVICLFLTLGIYYRPAWDARSFVREQAEDGFRIAYDGHRFISGEPIVSPQKSGTHHDPLKIGVLRRRFYIEAERVAWNGASAEFVVRHLIRLEGNTIEGEDASQDIHVRLERTNRGWAYTHFRVRGQGAVEDLDAGNPFATAASRAKPRG